MRLISLLAHSKFTVQHLVGDLHSLVSHVSLVKTPLFVPEGVSDPQKHEDAAVVLIVLLRVLLANFETGLLPKEPFAKFECILKNLIIKVVVGRVSYAIINDQISVFKFSEIPMILIVDWHDDS